MAASSRYYPLFFDIREKLCLVVGGGKVAVRKVKDLLGAGATVRVVAPKISTPLTRLAAKGKIELVEREYLMGDLKNAALVFAVTNDERVNMHISRDAKKRNLPVNVADNPNLCSFIVPAQIKKGPVTVAISTGGAAPGMAARLKKDIEVVLSYETIRYITVVARFRNMLMKRISSRSARQRILKEVADMDIGEAIRLGSKGLEKRFLGV